MGEIIANLRHGTATDAFRAVENGELSSFLHSNRAKWINWTRSEGNSLVGRIPYLRSKNMSVHRFRLHPIPSQEDTKIGIAVEATGIVYILVPLGFIIGFLMCCVGAIPFLIAVIAINNQLGQIQEELRQAIEAWDRMRTKRA